MISVKRLHYCKLWEATVTVPHSLPSFLKGNKTKAQLNTFCLFLFCKINYLLQGGLKNNTSALNL